MDKWTYRDANNCPRISDNTHYVQVDISPDGVNITPGCDLNALLTDANRGALWSPEREQAYQAIVEAGHYLVGSLSDNCWWPRERMEEALALCPVDPVDERAVKRAAVQAEIAEAQARLASAQSKMEGLE